MTVKELNSEPHTKTLGDLFRESSNDELSIMTESFLFGAFKRTLELLGLGEYTDQIPRDTLLKEIKSIMNSEVPKELQEWEKK